MNGGNRMILTECSVNNLEEETNLMNSLRADGWQYIGQSLDLIVMRRNDKLKVIHRNVRCLNVYDGEGNSRIHGKSRDVRMYV